MKEVGWKTGTGSAGAAEAVLDVEARMAAWVCAFGSSFVGGAAWRPHRARACTRTRSRDCGDDVFVCHMVMAAFATKSASGVKKAESRTGRLWSVSERQRNRAARVCVRAGQEPGASKFVNSLERESKQEKVPYPSKHELDALIRACMYYLRSVDYDRVLVDDLRRNVVLPPGLAWVCTRREDDELLLFLKMRPQHFVLSAGLAFDETYVSLSRATREVMQDPASALTDDMNVSGLHPEAARFVIVSGDSEEECMGVVRDIDVETLLGLHFHAEARVVALCTSSLVSATPLGTVYAFDLDDENAKRALHNVLQSDSQRLIVSHACPPDVYALIGLGAEGPGQASALPYLVDLQIADDALLFREENSEGANRERLDAEDTSLDTLLKRYDFLGRDTDWDTGKELDYTKRPIGRELARELAHKSKYLVPLFRLVQRERQSRLDRRIFQTALQRSHTRGASVPDKAATMRQTDNSVLEYQRRNELMRLRFDQESFAPVYERWEVSLELDQDQQGARACRPRRNEMDWTDLFAEPVADFVQDVIDPFIGNGDESESTKAYELKELVMTADGRRWLLRLEDSNAVSDTGVCASPFFDLEFVVESSEGEEDTDEDGTSCVAVYVSGDEVGRNGLFGAKVQTRTERVNEFTKQASLLCDRVLASQTDMTGVDDTLHRIFVLRDRHNVVNAVGVRFLWHHDAMGDLVQDLATGETKNHVLVCGPVSSGKTSMVRAIAKRLVSDHNQRVAIIDPRGNLCGPNESPLYALHGVIRIGFADEDSSRALAAMIREAVQNYELDVLVFDELDVLAWAGNKTHDVTRAELERVVTQHGVSIVSGIRMSTVDSAAHVQAKSDRNFLSSMFAGETCNPASSVTLVQVERGGEEQAVRIYRRVDWDVLSQVCAQAHRLDTVFRGAEAQDSEPSVEYAYEQRTLLKSGAMMAQFFGDCEKTDNHTKESSGGADSSQPLSWMADDEREREEDVRVNASTAFESFFARFRVRYHPIEAGALRAMVNERRLEDLLIRSEDDDVDVGYAAMELGAVLALDNQRGDWEDELGSESSTSDKALSSGRSRKDRSKAATRFVDEERREFGLRSEGSLAGNTNEQREGFDEEEDDEIIDIEFEDRLSEDDSDEDEFGDFLFEEDDRDDDSDVRAGDVRALGKQRVQNPIASRTNTTWFDSDTEDEDDRDDDEEEESEFALDENDESEAGSDDEWDGFSIDGTSNDPSTLTACVQQDAEPELAAEMKEKTNMGVDQDADAARKEDEVRGKDVAAPALKLFPESIVRRVIKHGAAKSSVIKKKGGSGNILLTRDAVVAVNAAACVFVNYVMAFAQNATHLNGKKTVSKDFVLIGLRDAQFGDFALALHKWNPSPIRNTANDVDDDDDEH
ncbi:protein ycf45 [Porphyridium purpureum]|uniref:Protein ycf45 n=1 Tax=Porphyridium purpureum TaxID=35688 RepID=A0A5J4YLB9_PORPP|nr:protein ycf45 [Porphyridium purpureum]|eukprot:POR0007..scf246_12